MCVDYLISSECVYILIVSKRKKHFFSEVTLIASRRNMQCFSEKIVFDTRDNSVNNLNCEYKVNIY